MTQLIHIDHDGDFSAAQEIVLPTLSIQATFSRFVAAVQAAPSGGTAVLRLQNVTGASPSEFIQATVADGAFSGVGTGTVTLAGGTGAIVRIVSNAGAAAFLRGLAEFEWSIAGAAGADLCSIADVKAFLGITSGADDALIQVLVSGVSAAMVRYIGGPVVRTGYTAELYDGTGWDALVLRNSPILTDSVPVSVTVDGAAIPSADYAVDRPAGLLIYTGTGFEFGTTWTKGRRNVAVTYEAGYATVPAELRLAAIEQSAYEVKQSKIRGDRLGEEQSTLGSNTNVYSVVDWVRGVEATLKRYRRLL